MSNKKLDITAGKYGAAQYPTNLDFFQRLYDTRRHRSHPVTVERLEAYANDLKIIAQGGESGVKFNPDFLTDDGAEWIAIRVRYVTGNKFYLAFPKGEDLKHHDGTISSQHVALFALDDEVTETELEHMVRSAYAVFYTYSH